MRTIRTNPGIGDACFIFQKIINSGEKFNFQIHNGPPQRGKQIFDLLPQLSASCEYVPGLPYSVVGPRNIQRTKKYWRLIQEQEFFLSANEWLEAGNRIETFLPDLPTSYSLPFQTAEWEEVVKTDFPGGPYIGIYASAYSTARAWGFWGASTGWYDLIWMMHEYIPEATFVQIGADWDIGVADEIRALMIQDHVPFISTIGKPLGYVIEMMKRLAYGFYFPSGLGILSGLLSRPSVMFYPPALPRLATTWADPQIIADQSFKECQFCGPGDIFRWVKDSYQLKNKL